MTVTSFLFFAFFGVSLLIYYLLPKRIQWATLLVFSLLFFLLATGSMWTIIYLIVGIVVTWFCAKKISLKQSTDSGANARTPLLIGIIVNVGILAVLKYNGFFINNFNRLTHFSVPLPSLVAPLGISFYTFSAVGYLISVYWGTAECQGSLAKTALFIGYYPVLTSGPILRYPEMQSQLYAPHSFDYKSFTFGLQRMLWGLFLKLVVSSRLGTAVDKIYGNMSAYPGLFIWFAAGLFMLQLYTDFSGCMEIILGVSECYGIQLPENFRTPFFSRSVQEFWQRWHITLGA